MQTSGARSWVQDMVAAGAGPATVENAPVFVEVQRVWLLVGRQRRDGPIKFSFVFGECGGSPFGE